MSLPSPSADQPLWRANRRDRSWVAPEPDPRALAHHRTLDGYRPTPLVELPALAAQLGVGRVFAKDESQRLGLPAFKALGAAWAVHRALAEHAGTHPGEGSVTLVTATDGNHGRALARFARLAGQAATVLVPRGVHPHAVAAIRSEGADVVAVDGDYDDAVRAAAATADALGGILVQDSSWEGYVDVPSWIVDGYATLFTEIDEQLAASGDTAPDLVVVPTGVGSLLQAAVQHYRCAGADGTTAVVSVEPDTADAVYASLGAGRPVSVDTAETVMAGLNCGTVSWLAWPVIRAGLDAALVTGDDAALRAVQELAGLGVDAGPCGAAPLAALQAVLADPDATAFREHVGLTAEATVVLLVTEGTAANPAEPR